MNNFCEYCGKPVESSEFEMLNDEKIYVCNMNQCNADFYEDEIGTSYLDEEENGRHYE